MLSGSFLITLLKSTFRMSTPLILGAAGEITAERSGVVNIGLEGQMLLGAFTAFCVSYYSGSSFLGILCGALAGAFSAVPLAVLGVCRRQDQSVVGIMFNILVLGLTSYLYRAVFGIQLTVPSIKTLPAVEIPVLSRIPVLGETVFSQNLLVYAAFLLTGVTWFVLFKTAAGLRLRAVGENPRAAQSAGISVIGTRMIGMFIAGLFGGLAGAFLTVAYVGRFTDDITAGRGYIALAITILGRWNPALAMGGALLFGLADAFQLRAQTMEMSVPYQFFVMLPYVVVLISIFFMGRNSVEPKALGKPFEKEGR